MSEHAVAAPAGPERGTPPASIVTAYAQAQEALRRLASGRAAASVGCMYAHALATLGLGEAASDAIARLELADPEWATAREMLLPQLVTLPAGTVAWSSRRRRFQANLDVLAARGSDVAPCAEAAATLAGRFLLCTTSDGHTHVYDRAAAPGDAWRGGLEDHRAAAEALTLQTSVPRFVVPFAFDGVGLGYLLERMLQITDRTYLQYSCACYVAEPDHTALAIWLHLHDLRSLLAQPRLRLCVGPAALRDFEAQLGRTSNSPPGIFFDQRLLPRPPLPLKQLAIDDDARRAAETERLRGLIDERLAQRDIGWWHRRFASARDGSGPPLRVLGITTRYSTVLQYTMAELGAAVAASGHTFMISMEPDDCSLERPDVRNIADFDPDLIILISRLRHENPFMPRNIPALTWDQDDLSCMRDADTPRHLDAHTYVAGVGALNGYRLRGWPARNCIFTQLAAATHRYDAASAPAVLRAQYACDFSYVSNASQPPEAYAAELLAQWTQSGQGRVFEPLAALMLAPDAPQYTAQRAAELVRAEAGRGRQTMPEADVLEMGVDLARLLDRAFRHQALMWIARYCQQRGKTLRLFGAGWERNPVLAPYACGPLAPGEEARAAYQASKINLQLLLGGFLHSRPLDGLAAGGFFLTRRSEADYGYDDGATTACHEMADRALELGLMTYDELAGSDDPVIRRTFPIYDAHTYDWMRPRTPITLREFAEMAPASAFFPELPAISFSSEAEFGRLATQYLADDAARTALAGRLRETVLRRFSYDARWQVFLRDVTAGLAAG